MAEYIEEEEWDDEAAVAYILENIFPDFRGKVTAEQVQYILDCEYDYYDSKGYFDEEGENDVDIDEDEAFDAICTQVAADGRSEELSEELIGAILDANYAYCEENGIFEDDEDADEDDDEYDEDEEDDEQAEAESIDYILENLPDEYRGKLKEEDIRYIISCEDIFLQTMEDHEEEQDEEAEITLEDEVNAICYMAQQDGVDDVITPEVVSVVVNLLDESFDFDDSDEENF